MILYLAFLLAFASGQESPAYKVEAQFVKVPVTVLDETGRSIMGLGRDDFRLLDEGQERRIENFVLDKSPVHVVFLLDVSGSIEEELNQIKNAVFRFAQAFGKEDRLAVIAFADEVRLLQDWTNKPKDLRKALKKLERGYRTALYDALFMTAHDKLSRVKGKKVIILLTDGLDNESAENYESVKDELIASNTVLYIVSRTQLIRDKIEDSSRVKFLNSTLKNVLDESRSFVDIYFEGKEAAMRYLAEVNGGRTLFPPSLPALGEAYLQIARELKTQYLLTFLPPERSDTRFRSIEVLCNQEVGKIYHRQIYLAH